MSDNKCKCGHFQNAHYEDRGVCNDPKEVGSSGYLIECPCKQFTPADDPAPDMVEKAMVFFNVLDGPPRWQWPPAVRRRESAAAAGRQHPDRPPTGSRR